MAQQSTSLYFTRRVLMKEESQNEKEAVEQKRKELIDMFNNI